MAARGSTDAAFLSAALHAEGTRIPGRQRIISYIRSRVTTMSRSAAAKALGVDRKTLRGWIERWPELVEAGRAERAA